jgi:hypothetical protein
MNYDFIPENKLPEEESKKRHELICKALLKTSRGIYDGRNYYAEKKGVCFKDGAYCFDFKKPDNGFLFYPTTNELVAALKVFKEKGYFPYYDPDVCEYGYVKDKSDIRGEYTIRHTRWL